MHNYRQVETMRLAHLVYRASRRVPLIRSLTELLLRSGRKYFWTLRPASALGTQEVPEDYITFVTGRLDNVASAFTLVEVGCGDGRVLRRLAALFPQARFMGIDLQKAAVDLGSKLLSVSQPRNENIELICGSCLEDVISWRCDYLISRTALIYLNENEIVEFLRTKLPLVREKALLQEIVSTTGKTELSHFYAHPLVAIIEKVAPGQFTVDQEMLDYAPWHSARWSAANLTVTRRVQC